ncbi:MAG: hypothetical protein ACREBC_36120, partial [Pyrinomonadaceae bacterium]
PELRAAVIIQMASTTVRRRLTGGFRLIDDELRPDPIQSARGLFSWLVRGKFGRKNILDARYLPVNRFGRKCIKGLGLILRPPGKISTTADIEG